MFSEHNQSIKGDVNDMFANLGDRSVIDELKQSKFFDNLEHPDSFKHRASYDDDPNSEFFHSIVH